MTQLSLHGTVLHILTWLSSGHAAFDGLPVIWRSRVAKPEPHVRVQALQPPQLLTAHFVWHGVVLHARVRVSGGHDKPLFAAGRTTFRALFCEPVPHVFEQVDQSCQPPTRQCTGHGWVSHGRDSWAESQLRPPACGRTVTRRTRIWEPPPHCCVHLLQSPQTLCWQLTGHGDVLHSRFSLRFGQILPAAERERFCSPEPHFSEHSLQLPQALILQSTGQAPSEHSRLSTSVGHASVPRDVTTRVRV